MVWCIMVWYTMVWYTLVWCICLSFFAPFVSAVDSSKTNKTGRAFSLFSIVQFPNKACTASSSSTTSGTCYTSSECSGKGGAGDGNCASGFGVCCIITTSTCGSTISTNTSYIRNPNFPSSYSPTSTGSCEIKVTKCSNDVCQLRIDFQTMTGFTNTVGVCTDKFAVEGQTGTNPPTICGTNTGYHMYVEFGAVSTDTATITLTYGDTSSKTWNILLRQIACTAAWKAPTDCVQYFTGTSGTIQSYNFLGAQLLNSMYYTNCVRTEQGFCKIQYKESTGQTPDTFDMFPDDAAGVADSGGCPVSHVYIPALSADGISPLFVDANQLEAFISHQCGGIFGLDEGTVPLALVSAAKPFIVGVSTHPTTALTAPTTGFSLDYTQLPC